MGDATQSLLYWLATVTIVLSLMCGASLIGVQYLADTYFWEKAIAMPFLTPSEITAIRHSVSRQSLLLYGVYTLEAATAVAALLCHLAMPSSHLEPVCLALYFACKTCEYGYWLEKAKQQIPHEQLQETRAKRLSVALSSWLWLFAGCAAVACFSHLRGAAASTESAWASTRFTIDVSGHWLVWTAMAMDWLHCLGFNAFFVAAHLGLFAEGSLPIEDMAPHIAQLNVHVLCSLAATLSTSMTLLALLSGVAAVQKAMWLVLAMDVMVNALAMFFTHSANREYVDTILCCKLSSTVLCGRLGLLECGCSWCCLPLVARLQRLKQRKDSLAPSDEEDDFDDIDFEQMVELELERENITRTISIKKNITITDDGLPVHKKTKTNKVDVKERDSNSGMLGLLNSLQME